MAVVNPLRSEVGITASRRGAKPHATRCVRITAWPVALHLGTSRQEHIGSSANVSGLRIDVLKMFHR
jgi:hypothetical protein